MLNLTLLPDPERELTGFEADIEIDPSPRPGFGVVTTKILLDGEEVVRYKISRDVVAPEMFSIGSVSPPSFPLPGAVPASHPEYWAQIYRILVPNEQQHIGSRADNPEYRSFRIVAGELIHTIMGNPEGFTHPSGRYFIRRDFSMERHDGIDTLDFGIALAPVPTTSAE